MLHPAFRGGLDPPPCPLSRLASAWAQSRARLRTLRQRLTADVWTETDDPYVLLEVPAEELPDLEAGFETAMDGFVDVVPNSHAVIERFSDTIVLTIHGQGFWTPVPFRGWPQEGDCDVIVVAKGLLPDLPADRELALADLVSSGHALVSSVPIAMVDACDML